MDVFSSVLVSADNIKVSARVTTDLFIKNFIDIFFGKSVSALSLGGVALTKTNENLLGRIYFRGVGCFWFGGMKLAGPVF